MPKPQRTLEDRFWRKVAIIHEPGTARPDPRPCWLWTGAKTTGQPNGAEPRGHVKVAGKWLKAHRVAFELATGRPVRKGFDVCHDGGPTKCVSPLCVNPFHLFEARHRENVRDWVLENRRQPNGRWTPRPQPEKEASDGQVAG